MKLYEINQAIIEALEKARIHAETYNGEIPEIMAGWLDELEMAKEEKAVQCVLACYSGMP